MKIVVVYCMIFCEVVELKVWVFLSLLELVESCFLNFYSIRMQASSSLRVMN